MSFNDIKADVTKLYLNMKKSSTNIQKLKNNLKIENNNFNIYITKLSQYLNDIKKELIAKSNLDNKLNISKSDFFDYLKLNFSNIKIDLINIAIDKYNTDLNWFLINSCIKIILYICNIPEDIIEQLVK